MERAHGVEEVGYHACTLADGEGGVFVGCFAVAKGEDYVSGDELGDEGCHGGDFGGGGYHFYACGLCLGWGEVGSAVAVFEVSEGEG